MKCLYCIFSFLCTSAFAYAQEADDFIRKGNELYKQQKFDDAEKEFTKALEKDPSNQAAINNLASAQYRLKKYDDAKKQFEKLTIGEKTRNMVKGTAFYNIGAVLSKEKKLEESIKAYKQSLRLNPADTQARENLQKALLELKKKQPPPKKEDKNKKPQQQPKQNQSKLNRKEVEKQLQLLQQKEKEVKQRMQNEKLKDGSGGQKDW